MHERRIHHGGHDASCAGTTPAGRKGLDRHPHHPPRVALTFDAGANADAVPSILATLRREGVPATIFLTGNFVRDFPFTRRDLS